MAQQRPEDIVQFYKECGLDAKENQLFKCECCRQESKPDFISDHVRMILHLYEKHDKSEIMEDPKYEFVAIHFDLSRHRLNFVVGKCLQLNCGVTIKSKFGKALQFKNHMITHHPDDNKNFFAKAVGIVSGQKILNNYEIKDTEIAECSFCQTSLPLKDLDSHTARVLAVLSRHLISHVLYVPKILKDEMPILDEAFIQTELEEEEKIHLNVNEKRQSIDEEVVMEETLRTIESKFPSEDLNSLLQRYNSKIIKLRNVSAVICQINKCGHQTTLVNDKLYRIRNHWEIHHGPKNKIYNDVKNNPTIQNIFLKYKITDGNLATCPDCQYYSKNLEEDTQLSFEKLCAIHEHLLDKHSDLRNTQYKKIRRENLQKILDNLREKRREAATQISHQEERSGQSIPNEDVPEIPGTSDSCEIQSAITQSSSTVEYRPGQRYSSGGESVSEASMSGEMQSTTTQSLLTDESLSKQMKLDFDSDVE